MTKQELQKKLSVLESVNDQLLTELTDLDSLMRNVGFPGGISGLKATAQELYSRRDEDENASF